MTVTSFYIANVALTLNSIIGIGNELGAEKALDENGRPTYRFVPLFSLICAVQSLSKPNFTRPICLCVFLIAEMLVCLCVRFCLVVCGVCIFCLYVLLNVYWVWRGVSWFSWSRLGVGLSGVVLVPDGESENSNMRKLKTCGAS